MKRAPLSSSPVARRDYPQRQKSTRNCPNNRTLEIRGRSQSFVTRHNAALRHSRRQGVFLRIKQAVILDLNVPNPKLGVRRSAVPRNCAERVSQTPRNSAPSPLRRGQAPPAIRPPKTTLTATAAEMSHPVVRQVRDRLCTTRTFARMLRAATKTEIDKGIRCAQPRGLVASS